MLLAAPRGPRVERACSLLCEIAGETQAKAVSETHAAYLAAWWQRYENPHTRYLSAKAARQLFRFLAESYGAPATLATLIGSPPVARPRTITWPDGMLERMLSAASPRLRCYLLLCGVHALRSGTAARICPSDCVDGVLRFRTKYGAIQAISITHDLAMLIRQCSNPGVPCIAQLPGGPGSRKLSAMTKPAIDWQFRKLRRELGLPSNLRLHDLRRTTARKVYEHTHDLRDSQNVLGHSSLAATVWYLQTEVSTTPSSLLEAARTPTERTQ